jgi:2-oxoglutarate dehydrogenase E2 component (dihydrolipoamide succinyltransferase)
VIRRLIIPPELGDEIEVRLLQWFKTDGETIEQGQALLEFETDKAVVLVTAEQAGTLRRWFYTPGEWMKPGDVVAWISDSPDEQLPTDLDSAGEAALVTFETT